MALEVASDFKLTVLNPSGRDPEQHFSETIEPGAGEHPPINFHAYAACTRGAFHYDVRRAIAEGTPVLLLLRGEFRASERALGQLKKHGRIVAVSLKETGLRSKQKTTIKLIQQATSISTTWCMLQRITRKGWY